MKNVKLIFIFSALTFLVLGPALAETDSPRPCCCDRIPTYITGGHVVDVALGSL